MRESQGSARLHQIDGLRALASCLVVVHHAGSSALGQALTLRGYPMIGNWISNLGASGVEMFFVLSGIVLLRPYLRRDRQAEVTTYLRRRIERLWPPYVVAWLMAGAFVYLNTRVPTWWSEGSDLPAFALSSWFAQLGIVHFGPRPYNFAWWSLSPELEFYLFVPALIWGRSAFRWLRGNLDYVCLGLALCLSLAHGAPAFATRLPLEVTALVSYAFCFAAGVVLARRDIPAPLAHAAMALGALFVVLSCALPMLNAHVGFGLLYFGWVGRRVVNPPGFLGRFHLVWLGERSYSLFLTHYTVFGIVSYLASLLFAHKSASYVLVSRLLGLPLALLVAMLVFQLVERRFAKNLTTAEAFWPFAPSARAPATPLPEANVMMTQAPP